MKNLMRGLRCAAAVTAVALGTGACSQLGNLGTIGDILGQVGGAGQSGASEVYGQVQYVDTQRQILQVSTQQGTGNVYFDNRTRVVYQDREYPVTALERGDEIGLRVQQDQRGNAYTDYIVVTRSVRDNGSSGTYPGGTTQGAYRTLEGRVNYIDYNRGQFEVQTQYSRVMVYLPYNPGAAAADRFRRLRQGDYVRIEGRLVSQDRFEVERFL